MTDYRATPSYWMERFPEAFSWAPIAYELLAQHHATQTQHANKKRFLDRDEQNHVSTPLCFKIKQRRKTEGSEIRPDVYNGETVESTDGVQGVCETKENVL
jgi:hypothetical protein